MDRSAGQAPQQIDDRDDHDDGQSDQHRLWVGRQRNCNVGAPRRIRTAIARSLSPSPLPVGLVERNGATGADRTRGLVLTENALSRLSYGGDGAREGGRLPGLRVTRAALYAELRGHDWCRRRGSELPTLALQKPCTSAVLRRQNNSQTAGTSPTKKNRCLKPPFAAPPKGTSTGSAGHLMSLQGRPS